MFFRGLHRKLDAIIALLIELRVQGDEMAADVKSIQAAVAAETTVVSSVVTLLNQLSAQIAANKTDPVALQAIADGIAANSKALSDAVVANTPASP